MKMDQQKGNWYDSFAFFERKDAIQKKENINVVKIAQEQKRLETHFVSIIEDSEDSEEWVIDQEMHQRYLKRLQEINSTYEVRGSDFETAMEEARSKDWWDYTSVKYYEDPNMPQDERDSLQKRWKKLFSLTDPKNLVLVKRNPDNVVFKSKDPELSRCLVVFGLRDLHRKNAVTEAMTKLNLLLLGETIPVNIVVSETGLIIIPKNKEIKRKNLAEVEKEMMKGNHIEVAAPKNNTFHIAITKEIIDPLNKKIEQNRENRRREIEGFHFTDEEEIIYSQDKDPEKLAKIISSFVAEYNPDNPDSKKKLNILFDKLPTTALLAVLYKETDPKTIEKILTHKNIPKNLVTKYLFEKKRFKDLLRVTESPKGTEETKETEETENQENDFEEIDDWFSRSQAR